jgi:AcrR family transcriptional regulator
VTSSTPGAAAPPAPSDTDGTPDAGTRRLRRDAERNRRRILVAARELLAEHGLALTLNDVAHHAGVGVGTVYRHFPDRDELIDAALAGPLETYAELIEQCLTIEDPWQALVQMTTQGLASHVANRGLRDAALGVGKGDHQTAVAQRILPLVDGLVERARRAGVVRSDVTTNDLLMIHFMVTELADHSADVRPEAYERYLALFVDALRARPDEPTLAPPLSTAETEAVATHWMESHRRRAV